MVVRDQWLGMRSCASRHYTELVKFHLDAWFQTMVECITESTNWPLIWWRPRPNYLGSWFLNKKRLWKSGPSICWTPFFNFFWEPPYSVFWGPISKLKTVWKPASSILQVPVSKLEQYRKPASKTYRTSVSKQKWNRKRSPHCNPTQVLPRPAFGNRRAHGNQGLVSKCFYSRKRATP